MTAIGRQPHRHRHMRDDVADGPLLAQGRGVPGAGVSVEQVGEPLVRLAHPGLRLDHRMIWARKPGLEGREKVPALLPSGRFCPRCTP